MEIIKTLYGLLTPRERRNLFLLFGAVLVMAGLEVVSVASIMPFLSVAADPASVYENVYLSWAYSEFGFTSSESFLVALGVGALAALVISNLFIVLTSWMLFRYVWGRNHSLSRRLLRSYLHRPYAYFLNRNSAELGKNILQEVKEVTGGMLEPLLKGGAKAIMALCIIGFLLAVNPVVAVAVAIVLGSAYVGLYFLVQRQLDWAGEERVESNTRRYQSVNEAFGGVKQVKIRGKEEAFVDQFDSPSRQYARAIVRSRIIRKAPRYILEALAFGGIILIAIYLIATENGMQEVIPILGLYAFAGYRLMPALQQAFKGIASTRYNTAALEDLDRGLQERASMPNLSENGQHDPSESALTLDDRLVLDDVTFTYPGADEPAIRELSMEVPAYTTTGFVGKTGSGKTTTVDLILGLLRPQEGLISVDGTPLREDGVLRKWQQDIGYVPQQIYLSDDTIARNIAFGVPKEDIDMGAVRDAARRAHIYDFVEQDLPKKWETIAGERGVKLSGGQRQRIGIARALYHGPSVLVFDEATSALDQSTEASVMEAIYELEDNHTMLIIAHRLSTVQRADNIVMLEDGMKVGEGDYSKLKIENEKFREMSIS